MWAPHWYSSVYESMSFAQYKPKNETVPDHLTGVLETCRGLYGILAEHRIKA